MAPLDGLLVADFSRVLAGPYAAMVLGDLGADVIKVERPGSGDDTRAWGPTYFLGLNRNKRSIALDMDVAGDRALARELCARADVIIESFRPGLFASWELVPVDCTAVVCSVTAFGSGPEAAGLPGYDLLLQAMGGLMSITGDEGRPMKAGAAVVDLVCGLLAAVGILAALREREVSGRGARIETTLMHAALATLLNRGSEALYGGITPRPLGNRHPSIAPYETVPCADGELALAVGNDKLFARLCAVLELPAADPRFATNDLRVEHREQLMALLAERLGRAPVEHWVERLRAAGVPAGPINTIPEAFELARSLGIDPAGAYVPGGEVRRPPPALDEHGAELRAWLTAARP